MNQDKLHQLRCSSLACPVLEMAQNHGADFLNIWM